MKSGKERERSTGVPAHQTNTDRVGGRPLAGDRSAHEKAPEPAQGRRRPDPPGEDLDETSSGGF